MQVGNQSKKIAHLLHLLNPFLSSSVPFLAISKDRGCLACLMPELERGIIQFYWVRLSPEKLKRHCYCISRYSFKASCIQKWFFLLSAWQCNIQNPFCKPLYILKLVLQAGTLPVIFLLFSWERIRHSYCPCICKPWQNILLYLP